MWKKRIKLIKKLNLNTPYWKEINLVKIIEEIKRFEGIVR